MKLTTILVLLGFSLLTLNQTSNLFGSWSIDTPDEADDFDSDVNIGCFGTCDQTHGIGYRLMLQQKEQGEWKNQQTTTGLADVEEGSIVAWADDLVTPAGGWIPGKYAKIVLEYDLAAATQQYEYILVFINDEAM